MSGRYFLDINTTTGAIVRREAISVSTGTSDADKIVRTKANGQLDESLFPSTLGAAAETIQASENLAAGDWVNIHEVSGARRVRRAVASDDTRPAHGYVTSAVTSGSNATVYLGGINTEVATTGFVASDVGRAVFLSASTSGGCSKTPPSSAGNVVQRLGYVVEVASKVRVQLDMSYIVTL